MTYKEQLLDPRWQRVRLEVMTRDKWKCRKCKSSIKTLNVHHKEYLKGRMAWEYDYGNLETLCHLCHKGEHEEVRVYATATPEQFLAWKLEAKEPPPVIVSLNQHISNLTEELKHSLSDELSAEIMKNIMFLQAKKKELLAN